MKLNFLLGIFLYSLAFGQYKVIQEQVLNGGNNRPAIHPHIIKLKGAQYAVASNTHCFIMDSSSLAPMDTINIQNRNFAVWNDDNYLVGFDLPGKDSCKIKIINTQKQTLDSLQLPYRHINKILPSKNSIYLGTGEILYSDVNKFPNKLIKLDKNLDTLWSLRYFDNGFEDLEIDRSGNLVALTQSGDLLKIDTSNGSIIAQTNYKYILQNSNSTRFLLNRIKFTSNACWVCNRQTPGFSTLYKFNLDLELMDSLKFSPYKTDFLIKDDDIYVLGSSGDFKDNVSHWNITRYNSSQTLSDSIDFEVENASTLYSFSGLLYLEGNNSYLATSSYKGSSQFKLIRIQAIPLGQSEIDRELSTMQFFPNPTKDKIFIQKQIDHVEIFDDKGQFVSRKRVLLGWVDTSDLLQGFYFIKIGNQTLKLIKL